MPINKPVVTSPIKSEAQLTMLTKVASDPNYAAQRGMTQETARQLLLDHKQAGSPPLVPGHVGDKKEKGPTPRIKKKKTINLFGGTIRR